MSGEIPKDVLSAHLAERIAGRRVLAGVFTTMEFDPGFFEQEVLPVVLGQGRHHHPRIRLAQLEDALRHVPYGVSVYYDQDHLQGSESPVLDTGRIPVRIRRGVFHPKVVMLLLQGVPEGGRSPEDAPPPLSLLVTTLSANLTRSGWWSNVEVAHTEEVAEGSRTRLRKPVTEFLGDLLRVSPTADAAHDPITPIREFLRRTVPAQHRSSGQWLHPHFYEGKGGVVEFLRESAGEALHGLNLEVISPYFDRAARSRPLEELIEEFEPKAVRVFLPRNEAGEALCDARMYRWLQSQPTCCWGRLPAAITRHGQQRDATERFVHAKVYRFFSLKPKREYLFVGSPNLTLAGHSGSNNREAGYLIGGPSDRKLDWWLEPDEKVPSGFRHESESDTSHGCGGTPLRLRFDWRTTQVEASFDEEGVSLPHSIEHAGNELFRVPALESGAWVVLPATAGEALAKVLRTTALLTVVSPSGSRAMLLVQEVGMERRPSLMQDLSPAEIMRYWATLDLEQRAQLTEEFGEAALAMMGGSEWVARHAALPASDSFFDRFAGIYQAFAALERSAREMMDRNETQDVVCRLFGVKQDSLEQLLRRVLREHEEGRGDRLIHYITGLCARQTIQEMGRQEEAFFREHKRAVEDVERVLARFDEVKQALLQEGPAEMGAFLEWFEPKFLGRAKPASIESAR